MKQTILNITVVLSLLIWGSACQEEKIEITLPPAGTTITNDAAVAKLISRVARQDGSADNILDTASCISIVLPVTITANGQTLVIATLHDLKDVEDIFDASFLDDDEIEFDFPIEITLSDFTTIQVNDEEEMEDLIEACGTDDDIECIDINYPVTARKYDTNNQVLATLTISNDEEFFNFLKQLQVGELASIDFPIEVILSDGGKVSVANFEQLENVIDDAEDDCDEDDDNDFNDDDVNESDFEAALTSGTWRVALFTDPTNRTNEFTGFVFSFNISGEATAINGAETETGEWETDGNTGELELELDWLSDEPLEDISEDWVVVSYSPTTIQLQYISGSTVLNLTFTKI